MYTSRVVVLPILISNNYNSCIIVLLTYSLKIGTRCPALRENVAERESRSIRCG